MGLKRGSQSFGRTLGRVVLFEILEGYYQHTEALTVFFAQMFVVHFMGPAYTARIPIVGISEYLEPLVYKNIVYREIGDAIGQNSKAKRQSAFSTPKISVFVFNHPP